MERDYKKLYKYTPDGNESREEFLKWYKEFEKTIDLFKEYQKDLNYIFCRYPLICNRIQGIYKIENDVFAIAFIDLDENFYFISASTIKECVELYKNRYVNPMCSTWDASFAIFIRQKLLELKKYQITYEELLEQINNESK